MEKVDEDPYEGFNDHDHAYDLEDIYTDKDFVEAVTRSSYGRRPITSNFKRTGTAASRPPIGTSTGIVAQVGGVAPPPIFRYGLPSAMGNPSRINRMSANQPPRSSMASRGRIGTAIGGGNTGPARPMTAVRAAGYSSAGATASKSLDGFKSNVMFPNKSNLNKEEKKEEDSLIEKVKKQENSVYELLKESIFAYDEKNFKKALEKAKEAGRKERATVKFRSNHSSLGDPNMDLTLTVLMNLAQQYVANNMPNEALHVWHTIVKNKSFANAGRLKVNIGNVYFRKRDFPKAIKYYRMALDQVPKVQQKTRTKILNNIGVTLVKLGKYEDALAAFEDCLDTDGEYGTALNLILTAYCLEDAEKMREGFQRLVDIPVIVNDEIKESGDHDVLAMQYLNADILNLLERRKKQQAERTILIAAKIISQSIASSFTEGYAWCVETIKQSVYASLAIELEMNKAVDLLKQGDIENAVEALMAFHNKESKVASAAANNLAIVNIMKGRDFMDDSVQYCEQALSLDRYNFNALVNRGNIYYLNGDAKLAQQYYKEALQIEASCVQAIYNYALVSRHLGELEEAKRYFFKLNEMLLNNVQVLTQLAAIYETTEDTAQAIDLYTQANNLEPTDPAILLQLANIYDSEGDKSQAFQCHYDSYRYFPPNIEVIKWLGNYYLYAQFAEKAINYFEKASLMEPTNIEWQLLIASCQRKTGNFQKAMELYRQIHRNFPNNLECLKFLVQLCKDLRMPEEKDYAEKLKRLEKVNQLRIQRESDSGHGKPRSSANSINGWLHPPSPNGRPPSSRSSQRNSLKDARMLLLSGSSQYQATKKDIKSADLTYKDPVGPGPYRPVTSGGPHGGGTGDLFDNDDIDDLLPE